MVGLDKHDYKLTPLLGSSLLYDNDFPGKTDWHYLIKDSLRADPLFFQNIPSEKDTKALFKKWIENSEIDFNLEKMDWKIARLSYFANKILDGTDIGLLQYSLGHKSYEVIYK